MSYLYFVVRNYDKQRLSQINGVNVACNLLTLLKSDDSDLLAANALSHFLCMLPLGDDKLARGHAYLLLCSLWAEGVFCVNQFIVTENHNAYTVLVRQSVIWLRNKIGLCSATCVCNAGIWVIRDSYEQGQKTVAVNGNDRSVFYSRRMWEHNMLTE
jgi:hypothetical protein